MRGGGSPTSYTKPTVAASSNGAAGGRDDLADPDGDPGRDTNGRVVVRAAAFGPFRTRRAVDAAVSRESGSLSVVAWGLVR